MISDTSNQHVFKFIKSVDVFKVVFLSRMLSGRRSLRNIHIQLHIKHNYPLSTEQIEASLAEVLIQQAGNLMNAVLLQQR